MGGFGDDRAFFNGLAADLADFISRISFTGAGRVFRPYDLKGIVLVNGKVAFRIRINYI